MGGTRESWQCLYVTVCIVPSRSADGGAETRCGQRVIIHHGSMRELVEWVEFNNMVLGTPEPYTPRFSVEHADGSPLSEEELLRLRPVASQEACNERISSGLLVFKRR